MRGHEHIHKDFTQTEISKVLLAGLSAYGETRDGKFSLSRHDCKRLLGMFEDMKRTFNQMEENGGYVLVRHKDSNTAITAYRLDSFRR